MSISLHIIADVLDQSQRDRLIKYLQIVKPPYIVVKGGERFDLAMQLTERIASETQTTVILREYPDDGLWKVKSVEQWYAERIAPHRIWIRNNRVVFMPDNESLEGDLTPYAHWMAQAIMKCAIDEILLAVGTFATGNPRETQYAQLDEMWQALAAYGGVWLPHEYMGLTPQLSGGHLNRYQNGWNRCKTLDLKPPTTVIGEIGLCGSNGANLDPFTGFRKLSINDSDYAHKFIIPTYESWYKPNGVTICVFCYGNWDNHGFDVGDGFLSAIEDYAKEAQQSMPAQIIQRKPSNATEQHKVQALVSIDVRMQAFAAASKISTSLHGEIQPGNKVMLYTVPGIPKEQWGWIYVRITSGDFAGNEGWILSSEFKYVDAPTKDIPPVVGVAIPPTQAPSVAPKVDTTPAPVFTTQPPPPVPQFPINPIPAPVVIPLDDNTQPIAIQSHVYRISIAAPAPLGDTLALWLQKQFESSGAMFKALVKEDVQFEVKEETL